MRSLSAACVTAVLLSAAAPAAEAQGLHGIDWHGPGIYRGGDDDRAGGYVIRSPYYRGYYGGYGLGYGYPVYGAVPYGYGYPSYGYGYPSYGYGYSGYGYPGYGYPGYGYGYPAYGYTYPGYYYRPGYYVFFSN